MPDLRRQIFESGKTVSRKAASRESSRTPSRTVSAQTSRQSSRTVSRNASRNTSRHPSDDDDAGSVSDDTALSIGSADDLDNLEQGNADWPQELSDRVQEILDRKRSSVQGREETYLDFCRLSKFHYVEEELRGRVNDLAAAFCKSIKLESSVRESTMALRALEILAITVSDNTVFENVEPVLSRTIRDSTSYIIKEAAIHCLGACSIFGGAGEDGIMDQMTFFLDIVASDGQSIDAADEAEPVAAALQEWGFLATTIEDLESESEEAIQIFIDQLGSGDANVQVAAGENIALLYEKSYTAQEDDEDEPDDDDGESGEEDTGGGPRLLKRYNAYHNTPELERQLQSLASIHHKRISKRDKKNLHSNFSSILTTVENPRRGPMYNTAIDQETNRAYGSRLTVKVGREGVMNIDRWWKWIRLNSLRRILEGGFAVHYYQGNRAVLDNLPVIMRMDAPSDRTAPRKAAKQRASRRMAMAGGSDEDY